jgi:N-methylhydantoinase A
MSDRRLRIAVDVGGTFTDATLWDPRGNRLIAAKAPTTPKDRALGVLDAVKLALEVAGEKPGDVRELIHGSTTGTNALIARTGA